MSVHVYRCGCVCVLVAVCVCDLGHPCVDAGVRICLLILESFMMLRATRVQIRRVRESGDSQDLFSGTEIGM